MGKSKQGGVFGYLRGKVGSVTYSVQSAKASGTGKAQQIVRALPESVSNPQTVGQTMQRMKLAPAQKFFSAFNELLSNAYQGVAYGDASRRYFMSKAMSADGPYIQKGVDRFIPAAYLFSEGSLPSVGIEPFSGGASVITLNVTTEAAEVTPAVLAAALGITTDYQISVAVCNNVNGIFVPSYIPFADRLKVGELPAGALSKDTDGHITISPSALGLDMSAMVACCVVLSVQDASGAWLRSTQEMIISNELRNTIYGAEALEAAIYSYQDTTGAANAINSEWYYNLGLAQAWGGKITTALWQITDEGDEGEVVMGIKQIDGRIKQYIFATATTDDGLVILVENGQLTTKAGVTVGYFKSTFENVESGVIAFELWNNAYATQLGIIGSSINGGGDTPSGPAFGRKQLGSYWWLTDTEGVVRGKAAGEDEVEVLRVPVANIDSATAWTKATVTEVEATPYVSVDEWVGENDQYTGFVKNGNTVDCTPPKDGTVFE